MMMKIIIITNNNNSIQFFIYLRADSAVSHIQSQHEHIQHKQWTAQRQYTTTTTTTTTIIIIIIIIIIEDMENAYRLFLRKPVSKQPFRRHEIYQRITLRNILKWVVRIDCVSAWLRIVPNAESCY
jgi:hypothetical protein